MSDGYSTIIEFNAAQDIGTVILGHEFNAPSIVALGDIAMGGNDNALMDPLTKSFLNQSVGVYKNTDNSVEIDVTMVDHGYLGLSYKVSGSTFSMRLLSLPGSNNRFSVDNGADSLDQVMIDSTGLTYLEPNGTDSSGKTLYHGTLFQKAP